MGVFVGVLVGVYVGVFVAPEPNRLVGEVGFWLQAVTRKRATIKINAKNTINRAFITSSSKRNFFEKNSGSNPFQKIYLPSFIERGILLDFLWFT